MDAHRQLATETHVAEDDAPRSTGAGSSLDTASARDDQIICWSTANRMFWLVAWLGTVVSGGLYGAFFVVWAFATGVATGGVMSVIVICVFALYAFVVGAVAAGTMAIPLHISAAAATWALWLPRFRVAVATIGGAATGVFSSMAISSGSPAIFAYSAAGIFGGLGTFASLHWYQARTEGGRWLRRVERAQPWRFSLSDMLRHFAVLGVLFACWAWVINTVFVTRERPLQPNEVRMDDPPNAIPAVMAP